jgi:hypothetical protein
MEANMGILTNDMRRMLNEQQLGFIATVCPDGTPNLSPKGTTAVWDDEHLIFADICSPNTIAILRQNPALEINVVDTLSRKGYCFKGVDTIVSEGPQFDELLDFYRKRGSTSVKRRFVLVKVELRRSPDFTGVRHGPERGASEHSLANLLGRALGSAIETVGRVIRMSAVFIWAFKAAIPEKPWRG